MPGYYDVLAQGPRTPSLIEIMQAAGLTRAQRDQRAFQREQFDLQKEQATAERQADIAAKTQKEAATKQTMLANKQRYFAQLLEANPGQSEQILQAASKHGIDIGQPVVSLPGGEEIEASPVGDFAQQQDPRQLSMDWQGQAAGVLGAPKPGEESRGPELDPVGRRVILEQGLAPGTPEFQQAYSKLAGIESEEKLLERKTKAGGMATDLRKEFQGNKVYKDTQEISSALRRAQSSGATPAGDIALIFSYMKLLDPGSTVREGEYASARDTAGVPDRVRNLYNQALTGRILGEAQRSDFLGQSNRLWNAQLESYNRLASQFSSLAERYGVPSGDVVLPLGMGRQGGKKSDTVEQGIVDGWGE